MRGAEIFFFASIHPEGSDFRRCGDGFGGDVHGRNSERCSQLGITRASSSRTRSYHRGAWASRVWEDASAPPGSPGKVTQRLCPRQGRPLWLPYCRPHAQSGRAGLRGPPHPAGEPGWPNPVDPWVPHGLSLAELSFPPCCVVSFRNSSFLVRKAVKGGENQVVPVEPRGLCPLPQMPGRQRTLRISSWLVLCVGAPSTALVPAPWGL